MSPFSARRVLERLLQLRRKNFVPSSQQWQLYASWKMALKKLKLLGGVTRGNSVTIFHDGDYAFERMWKSIEVAQHRVWLESYIFEPDRVGKETCRRLQRAAKRGCNVVLLIDHWGSPFAEHAPELRALRAAGAHVVVFNPVWPWDRGQGPLLFRNHRKILVADEEGFCGGMNVAEDYAGIQYGTGRFRDSHIWIRGPAVGVLAGIFTDSLRETGASPAARFKRWEYAKRAGGASISLALYRKDIRKTLDRPAHRQDTIVQILQSNVQQERRHIQRALHVALQHAHDSAFFTTPYFLPPRRLMRHMIQAARRGVDVRVLTAGKSDVPLSTMAAQHIYGSLLRNGVRIFEYQGRTLHAKTATVDGLYAIVGSFNLDIWSFERNLEVICTMIDPSTATDLTNQFSRDCRSARELTLSSWESRSVFARALHWAAYQFMLLFRRDPDSAVVDEHRSLLSAPSATRRDRD